MEIAISKGTNTTSKLNYSKAEITATGGNNFNNKYSFSISFKTNLGKNLQPNRIRVIMSQEETERLIKSLQGHLEHFELSPVKS